MNQTAKLREIDALISEKMSDAGLADAATYDGQPCTVLVDRDVAMFGVDLAALRIVVSFFRAEIPVLERGGTLKLTATGEEFELDELQRQDEARSAWTVKRA